MDILTDVELSNFSVGNAWRAALVASDVLLLAFTWAKTWRVKRETMRCGLRAPLPTLLLRDGTMYFTFVNHHYARRQASGVDELITCSTILVIEIISVVSINVRGHFIIDLFNSRLYIESRLARYFLEIILIDEHLSS